MLSRGMGWSGLSESTESRAAAAETSSDSPVPNVSAIRESPPYSIDWLKSRTARKIALAM